MEKNQSVKNEKINAKIAEIFAKAPEKSTLYDSEKNLNTGKEYIKLNDKGYAKLCDFFYNQDNITLYNINAYYIERLNDIKKVYNERIERNGQVIEKNHTYYARIASDSLEYAVYKTILDE